ncbi:hypothetical protein C3489_25145 [Streptomyces sp. Ru71]|uniref:hypothetical protein n=1 Tax=Streptomyces sp. Ru71 TaxID=2080746 RepID=UPI000CDDE1A4|nr:hypothetical protein [Streptomyces sp. Ru71]POX49326.1 hypothetical protein C3489_25145 [Streptomyces sp. Ru71]
MNSAPQIQTAEISEAELDAVAGGLATPHASVVAGSTTLTDAGVLAEAGAVKDSVLATVAGIHQAGVTVSF